MRGVVHALDVRLIFENQQSDPLWGRARVLRAHAALLLKRASDTALASFRGCRERMRSGDNMRGVHRAYIVPEVQPILDLLPRALLLALIPCPWSGRRRAPQVRDVRRLSPFTQAVALPA